MLWWTLRISRFAGRGSCCCAAVAWVPGFHGRGCHVRGIARVSTVGGRWLPCTGAGSSPGRPGSSARAAALPLGSSGGPAPRRDRCQGGPAPRLERRPCPLGRIDARAALPLGSSGGPAPSAGSMPGRPCPSARAAALPLGGIDARAALPLGSSGGPAPRHERRPCPSAGSMPGRPRESFNSRGRGLWPIVA
jgi:hypothetical protein